MHASSMENMQKCYDRFLTPTFFDGRDSVAVLDIGAANVNGSYRTIFQHPKINYIGVDMAEAPGVDLVLGDPYSYPLESSSVDVVISGQALEHSEFFWRVFEEMLRVLKPDGYLFLIVPSAGPIHRYPVDCYRFYPDAYRALAKYANCCLVEMWHDERGPWNDLVGVFQKHYSAHIGASPSHGQGYAEPEVVDSVEEDARYELTKGSQLYLETLQTIHSALAPERYLEIGVRFGKSISLAACKAVGVDPAPQIPEGALGDNVAIYQGTSDNFYEHDAHNMLPEPPDLTFIDGMHHFEYALRDFMNAERYSHAAALVVIDDIFPNHEMQARRERATRIWTGDVWKVFHCLSCHRPDLFMLPLDCEPTGLLLIAGLDSKNRVLWNRYNPIMARYNDSDQFSVPPKAILERQRAIDPKSPLVLDLLTKLRDLRDSQATSEDVRAAMKGLVLPVKGAD